jgi:hypothetical protein
MLRKAQEQQQIRHPLTRHFIADGQNPHWTTERIRWQIASYQSSQRHVNVDAGFASLTQTKLRRFTEGIAFLEI